MVPKSLAFTLLGCAACGSVTVTGGPDAGVDPDVDAEVAPDAVAEPCDLAMPFGEPEPVMGVDSVQGDEFASLSPDELTIYFASNRQDPDTAAFDIYVATRASRDEPFGAPVNLTVVNAAGADDRSPSISEDGLELYFHSSRTGFYEIYVSTRPNTAAAWSAPGLLGPGVNSADIETGAVIADGGDTLYFERYTATTEPHVFRATRGPTGFDNATELTVLGPGSSQSSTPSADGLTLYFASDRPGGKGLIDIWAATRATTDAPFGSVTAVAELNTPRQEMFDWVSPDGCRAYLTLSTLTDWDLYVASRPE